jgi:hypothetical protein
VELIDVSKEVGLGNGQLVGQGTDLFADRVQFEELEVAAAGPAVFTGPAPKDVFEESCLGLIELQSQATRDNLAKSFDVSDLWDHAHSTTFRSTSSHVAPGNSRLVSSTTSISESSRASSAMTSPPAPSSSGGS